MSYYNFCKLSWYRNVILHCLMSHFAWWVVSGAIIRGFVNSDPLWINHPFTAFCQNWDFFNQSFLCKVMSFWIQTIHKLVSIACGTYNACKFWTRKTSGSVRELTISWKYAYKNLMLHSASPKHSVVTNALSSARNRSSHMTIELWTHVT